MYLKVAEGRFEQIAPDGATSAGRFWLHKPGRLRFIYDAPSSPTLMTDGTWLVMKENDMLPQRYPLNMVPLSILLADSNGAMPQNVRTVALYQDKQCIYATYISTNIPGRLTLILQKNTYELRGWIVEDMQGFKTRIKLKDVNLDASPPPDTFFTWRDRIERPFVNRH